MTVRGWGRVLLATLLLSSVGCSNASDDADSTGQQGGFHGGQTGSLRPCSTPWEASQGGTVPAGDAALVFHTGCSAGNEITLTDNEGEPVAFELVELDDGVVLLRAGAALEPGDYRVETPDGSEQTLTVTEPAPLPMKLGTLTRVANACSRTFQLELDPAVLPYLSLLRLEYSLDGSARLPWFEYGTLPQHGSAAPLLAVGSLTPGSHRLEVFPSIAGETSAPDTAALDFVHECYSAEPSESGCAVAAPLRSDLGAGMLRALPGFLVFVLLCLRRRRSVTD